MAEGHNFHLCSNVILLAYSWAFDKFYQAIKRVHRITSPKPVNLYSIITDGSIAAVTCTWSLPADRVSVGRSSVCNRARAAARSTSTR